MADNQTEDTIEGVKKVINEFLDELKHALGNLSDKFSKTVDVWAEDSEPKKSSGKTSKVTPMRKSSKAGPKPRA